MNTLNFLDASVWLALIWSQHVHSGKARSWFEQASVDRTSDEQFFFCRFTQITVLRLLTTSQVMGKERENHVRGLESVGQNLGRHSNSIPVRTERPRKGVPLPLRLSTSSPKVWADPYILAFAAAAGLKFVTFDRALQARGVDVLVL
jgi:predicted nucleic acid-binding protein